MHTSTQVYRCSVGLGCPGDRAPDEPHLMTYSSGIWAASRKPKRLTITVSNHVFEAIVQRSVQQGRSMSNAAAFALEAAFFPPEKQDR